MVNNNGMYLVNCIHGDHLTLEIGMLNSKNGENGNKTIIKPYFIWVKG